MCTVFAHFFIFSNVFTQSGLNNEQSIEPHAFLMMTDLAPHPPPPPVSKLDQRDIGRLIKGLVLQI
jgi:hypothetical protein